ncbi:MAG TPA: extracellular solute-binding protein [Candidatus Acidoferrales bacterium]|nr:extracellular solute-binding protein [Candidatus Acidoferrales bacterium]
MKARLRASLVARLVLGLSSGLCFAPAGAQTIDEVYKQALKEGGTLNFYGTLAQVNASRILPVFEKRFPGIKVNHVDATADKLAARAIAEARGGRTIGDIFQGSIENVMQIYEQKLVLEKLPPEAADYPASLKGSYWLATDMIFFIGAWNTNLVKKGDEPKGFEDFADPKWKGKLMGEPRDVEVLIGLARHKYKDDEKAIALLRKIAANNVEFHRGHSDLAELLVAGQGAACFTCYSHHFPPRIKKGAPVNYFLTEGVATIQATAAFKDAPHPNTAWLFFRWVASEEGQKAYAEGGRTAAHPRVQPVEKTRPEKIYALGTADLKEWSRYEKIWKEIFKLR